jgi:tRNA (guanine-N7-)-methyltransferase
VFYGRRKGRALSPTLCSNAYHQYPHLSVDRWRNRWPSDMWMEIGFGYGEHLVQWMVQHPQRSMIGVEVFENGWVSCVNQLPDHGMDAFALFNEPVEEFS